MNGPAPSTRVAQLSERLAQIRQQIKARDQLCVTLRGAEQEQAELMRRGQVIDSMIAEQEVDYEALRGIGGILHLLTGERRRRLGKLEKSLASLRQQQEAVQKRLAELAQNIPRMRQIISTLEELETEHALVLAAKNEAIAEAGGEPAEKLMGLSEQLAHAWSDCQSYHNGISHSERCRAEIESLIRALNQAGEYLERRATQNSSGNGLRNGARPLIDQTRLALERVRERWEALQTCLRDVNEELPLLEELVLFGGYLEHYQKGMVGDWAMRQRISSTLDAAILAGTRFDQLEMHLRHRLEGAQMRAERLADTRRDMIEGL